MLRERIRRLVRYVTVISVGTLIACTFWCGITFLTQGEELFSAQVPYVMLPEILLLGIVCGTGTELILACGRPPLETKVRWVMHYVFINIAVLVLGGLFGWYRVSVPGVFFMCITSAAVYAFTYGMTYLNDLKTADRMNRKLQAYQEEAERNLNSH